MYKLSSTCIKKKIVLQKRNNCINTENKSKHLYKCIFPYVWNFIFIFYIYLKICIPMIDIILLKYILNVKMYKPNRLMLCLICHL